MNITKPPTYLEGPNKIRRWQQPEVAASVHVQDKERKMIDLPKDAAI
jgi:hypothetical protein